MTIGADRFQRGVPVHKLEHDDYCDYEHRDALQVDNRDDRNFSSSWTGSAPCAPRTWKRGWQKYCLCPGILPKDGQAEAEAEVPKEDDQFPQVVGRF